MTHRAKIICSPDILEEELKLIQDLLRRHANPLRFLMKHMSANKPKIKSSTAPKKPIFLKLQFKGDIFSEIVTRCIQKALERTSNEA